MLNGEKQEDINGQSPQNEEGIEPAATTQSVEPQPMGEQTYEEKVNNELNQAIKDDIMLVDPKIFEGVVQDLAQLLQEFKDQLPVFQLLQFTNPEAYQNLLKIVNTMTTLSQLMIQNGDLPTDHDVVSQQVQQDIVQNMQGQEQESGSSGGNEDAAKVSRTVPVGTLRPNGANGRMRIKGSDGQWHYVGKGLTSSAMASTNKSTK